MDPVTPQPSKGSESAPVGAVTPEVPTFSADKAAPAPKSSARVPTGLPVSATPIPQVGLPSVPVAQPASMPLAAEDVDVIEKEWVDRADDLRKQTLGDPHAEEEAIETLQQQYLKQRYGRDVGKPQDE